MSTAPANRNENTQYLLAGSFDKQKNGNALETFEAQKGNKEITKFYMCNHKNLRGRGEGDIPSDGFTIFLFTKPPINT